jgi:diacylglycerol kinase
MKGILAAIGSEKSFRYIIVCTVLAVAAGFLLGLSALEWCAVALCCGGVFAVELLNTAIECVINMFVHEYNAQAGRAKDIAAGATLIFVAVSLVIAAIIYIPHILKLLG